MKIKSVNFDKNGKGALVGTLIVIDDDGEYLGVEHYGTFSSPKDRETFVGLLEELGIPEDKAKSALRDTLKHVREQLQIDPPKPADGQFSGHSRPVIMTNDRHLRETVDESWNLLERINGQDPKVFGFADTLAVITENTGQRRTDVLDVVALRSILDRHGDYIKLTRDGEKPDRPPRDVLDSMLARQETPQAPPLQRIVHSPVVRPDGSTVSVEGYDPTSELYVDLNGLEIPSIPDDPSPEDIQSAKKLIMVELLGDFPFAKDSDKAHAVALLMNPIVRSMVNGPTPLYLIDSPTPGTGKGLVAEVTGIIATGASPFVMTEANDQDEWRKRITSQLLVSPTIVLIDNIRRRLDSSALAAALTTQSWKDRMLGFSRMVSIPITCTWIATGNNAALSNEMARRIVRIRLDAKVERPWERSAFKHPDLSGWALEHRSEVVGALLLLIRAWVVAGMPKGSEVMGSFQQWANTMGGILQVARIKSFLEDREEMYAQADVEMEAWHDFVGLWWVEWGETPVGVAQLIDIAKERGMLADLRGQRSEHGSRTAMGKRLSNLRDQVLGKYVIRAAGLAYDAKTLKYQLMIADTGPK